MKTVITYASIHHGNTKAIAQVMAEELEVKANSFLQMSKDEIYSADLVGFGSGVYYGIFHRGLISLIQSWPPAEGRKAFVFSTSGVKRFPLINRAHQHIKRELDKKGWEVVGEFDCRGFDTYSVLKLLGGMNKGRPNEQDKQQARQFARQLKEQINLPQTTTNE